MSASAPQTYLLGRASAALAIFAALLGSTAPSPLYPIYIAQMHLSHVMGTAVFAIYAVGTLFALALTAWIGGTFQDLRKLILPGLVVTGVGAVLFATAHSLIPLLIGRLFNGFGTGIVTGMASVALYNLSPRSQKALAATVATLAFTGGAAGGPLLSSAALALGVAPTLVPFLIIVAIALLAGAGLLSCAWPKGMPTGVPKTAELAEGGAGAGVGTTQWPLFYLACYGVAVAWLFGSTLMAIGAGLGTHVFGLQNASLAGLIPALFQLFGGIGQAICGKINPIKSIGCGLCGMVVMQAMLGGVAVGSHGLTVLWLMSLYGFAYGAIFVGALGLASRAAAPHKRENLISRFYIVGYLANAIPALLMGVLIDLTGLEPAFWVLSGVVVITAGGGAVLCFKMKGAVLVQKEA